MAIAPLYPHVPNSQTTSSKLNSCPNCNRVVDDNWRYCAYCAYRLKNEDSSRRVPPQRR